MLKARQLGVSWLLGAYAAWVATFERSALILLISQTKPDAVELLRKCKHVIENLPQWLQPEGYKPFEQVIKCVVNKSAIVALPSTPRAGRGRTARLVIGDEYAQHAWAAQNFAATKPTAEAGGQVWFVSTASGFGNQFSLLWGMAAAEGAPVLYPSDAKPGAGRILRALRNRLSRLRVKQWLPVFLPYCARPGRDAAWWEAEFRSNPQPWITHQEYPRDPDEAFVQTGRPVFNPKSIAEQRELCREPLERGLWPAELRDDPDLRDDELRVFEAPLRDMVYAAGADVAEGLERGDYDDLTVNAASAGRVREVLSLHGHFGPKRFARLIHAVSRAYPGVYGVERNNHGHAVLLELANLGTFGVYHERPVLSPKGAEIRAGKPGWETDKASKPVMIDELAEALHTLSLRLSDAQAISELTIYQQKADGKTGAPEGLHDDRVMSRAIALQMVKRRPPRVQPQAATLPPDGSGRDTVARAPRRW